MGKGFERVLERKSVGGPFVDFPFVCVVERVLGAVLVNSRTVLKRKGDDIIMKGMVKAHKAGPIWINFK